MGRIHGRVTKEDVREAGLRRWDGRQRVTTDWINMFQEPELSWSTGDCLVYLREPGQSSRGPAFQIHTDRLKSKGFSSLLDRCVIRPPNRTSPKCVLTNCSECELHHPTQELFIPAPPRSSQATVFDHHISTRNFFAWLYDIPLAGRALGKSLIALKQRIDYYRPDDELQNKLDVVTYAESQRYLDFRECPDHALAALYVAEVLEIEKLWVDAFAHCVGLRDRGLRQSVEYEPLSSETKASINRARLDLDVKVERVRISVENFFENDLSDSFLGLPSAARDHLDRFRSFLHAFYIEQHGFWPPSNFRDEQVQRSTYTSMYFDFRNLYHHLADTKSSTDGAESDMKNSGGICTRQNIRAFDNRHGCDPLPCSMPMIPVINTAELGLRSRGTRRQSWNPLVKRKLDRETRNARCMQALVDSSNRDWSLMNCVLVRRYSDFEVGSAVDEHESISLADARKVRWILIYSILQILVLVVQAPRHVRNTEGLTYSLCCRCPKTMPWQWALLRRIVSPGQPSDSTASIAPDSTYSHTNTSSSSLVRSPSAASTVKERRESRESLIAVPARSILRRSTSMTNTNSLRKLMPKRAESFSAEVISKRASYCEIYVQGYGNGLNEVHVERSSTPETITPATYSDTNPEPEVRTQPEPVEMEDTSIKREAQDPAPEPPAQTVSTAPEVQELEAIEVDVPVPQLPGTPSMSRESSKASTSSSAWSQESSESDTDISTPDSTPNMASLQKGLRLPSDGARDLTGEATKATGDLRILDQTYELPTVHFNNLTWDALLAS